MNVEASLKYRMIQLSHDRKLTEKIEEGVSQPLLNAQYNIILSLIQHLTQ